MSVFPFKGLDHAFALVEWSLNYHQNNTEKLDEKYSQTITKTEKL